MPEFPDEVKDAIEKAIKENNQRISQQLIEMYERLDKRISAIEHRLGIA